MSDVGVPATTAPRWDRVVDVVVVGSGAAALTAATLAHDGGAKVLVVEKAAAIGGTSAVSGGVMWLPGNDHMAEVGVTDHRADAIAYLMALAEGGDHDAALVERFVDTAPATLRYLEAHTPLRVRPLDRYPDYYVDYDVPGTRPAGRSVEPEPYPVGDELPEWRHRVASRATLLSLGAVTTLAEDFAPLTEELRGELAERTARDVRTKGAALVAMLFRGLLDRGIETRLETAAHAPITDRGAVVGVHVRWPGGGYTMGTRRGVVLACGGYEWDPALVRTFIGYDVHPLSPPNNVGDGLRMAMAAGAQLACMSTYWGQPAMFDPGITSAGSLVPQFEWGRGEPSSLVVDRHGQRFANEAAPYNDFTKAFGVFDAGSGTFPHAAPAWLIFDQRVRDTTRILSMLPGEPTPPWVTTAPTIRRLAEQLAIDADALDATVARFDEHARNGDDPDHGRTVRGLMGAGRVHPLDQPPYYAVAMYPGALGTTGGPRIDVDGRVRSMDGGVITGLYAAGNTAGYHSRGGGTLGHGIVFGYLAGRHVASQPPRELTEAIFGV